MDDVLTALPSNQVTTFLNHINNINPNIQFTHELESNNLLSYLDMKLQRKQNGELTFSVYRKETHSNRYLDYKSNNPLCHKRSVVRSLTHRANNICNDETIMQDERQQIITSLKNNNYPIKFIKENMRTASVSSSVSQPQIGKKDTCFSSVYKGIVREGS